METAITNFKAELEISELKRLRFQRHRLIASMESDNLSFWIMLDLMTLILVFFIILYADLLMQNSPKYIEQNLSTGPPVHTSTAKTNTQSKHDLHPIKKSNFIAIEKKLYDVMGNTDLSNYTVKTIGNKTMLTIGENLSFPVGQAQLLDHIKPTLKKMASFFNRENTFKIIVSGHTDNTPIHNSQFSSNWELSVARALSVAKFLISADVDPLRISVEGYGQYRPIEDNYYIEGRQANRRVEISLIQE